MAHFHPGNRTQSYMQMHKPVGAIAERLPGAAKAAEPGRTRDPHRPAAVWDPLRRADVFPILAPPQLIKMAVQLLDVREIALKEAELNTWGRCIPSLCHHLDHPGNPIQAQMKELFRALKAGNAFYSQCETAYKARNPKKNILIETVAKKTIAAVDTTIRAKDPIGVLLCATMPTGDAVRLPGSAAKASVVHAFAVHIVASDVGVAVIIFNTADSTTSSSDAKYHQPSPNSKYRIRPVTVVLPHSTAMEELVPFIHALSSVSSGGFYGDAEEYIYDTFVAKHCESPETTRHANSFCPTNITYAADKGRDGCVNGAIEGWLRLGIKKLVRVTKMEYKEYLRFRYEAIQRQLDTHAKSRGMSGIDRGKIHELSAIASQTLVRLD